MGICLNYINTEGALSDWVPNIKFIYKSYYTNKTPPSLWKPQTKEELYNAYKLYWEFLADKINILNNENKKEALNILLRTTRLIIKYGPQNDNTVFEYIRKFSSYNWINKKDLLKAINDIIHYEKKCLSSNALKHWKTFSEELTGQSFSDRLKRFVEMNFLTDYFIKSEGHSEEFINNKLKELVREILKKPELLEVEYCWLLTTNARRGSRFGEILGELDTKNILLKKLIEKQINYGEAGGAFLLSGYFRSLYKRKPEEWKKQLELLSTKDKTIELMAELIWRTELNNEMAIKILTLIERGKLDINNLSMFTMGGGILKLPEKTFLSWIKALMKTNQGNLIIITLDLLSTYYTRKKDITIPETIVEKILLHKTFWENPERINLRSGTIEYEWTELAKLFLTQVKEEDKVRNLIEHLIKYFGDSNSIVGDYHTSPQTILWNLLNDYSKLIWNITKKYIGPPKDNRAFYLHEWLKGRRKYAGGEIDPTFSKKGAME